jgi:hypothetical protein
MSFSLNALSVLNESYTNEINSEDVNQIIVIP